MSSPHPSPYGTYGPPSPGRDPRTGLLVAIVIATVLVVGGIAAAVVLATNDNDTPARAEPRPKPEPSPTPEPSPSPAPTPTREPSPVTVSTKDLRPCDLLTDREADQLGFDRGEKDFLDPRACVWEFADPGNAVRVWVQDDLGLAVVGRDGSRTVGLGDHEAIQRIGPSVGPVNSCEVAIGVTGSSRVDVVVNTTFGKAKACRLALRTARVVEPKLP